MVQAAVKADLGATWIQHLRAAGAGQPMKWKGVADFVMNGDGHEARTVRDALGEETIVLTDPMELVRRVDMTLMDSGAAAPICGIAITSATHYGNWSGSDLASKLRNWIALDLLQQSGVGTVSHLISTMGRSHWDFFDESDGIGCVSAVDLQRRLGGQLRRVARLATQATTLVAHERDPDYLPPNPYPLAEVTRFSTGTDPFEARMRLRRIGESNIIFDRDEPPITGMVEEVRRAAETRGSYDWLFQDAGSGSVRTADDALHVRLQLADIAAGYASALIARDGLIGLAVRFRFVLYNGEHLTLERAAQLDKTRATHRQLLIGSAPR